MNKKLMINANLLRKESEFRTKSCVVEKAIAVSHAEFDELKRHPLRDNALIAENVDLMYCGKNGNYHCLLIYDSQDGDGLMIESEGSAYARYAQYISGVKDLVQKYQESEISLTNGEQKLHELLIETADRIAMFARLSYSEFSFDDVLQDIGCDFDEVKQVVTETLVDFRDNVFEEKTNDEVKRTSAYYANGQLKSQTDALGNTTKYEYSFLNKLTKTEAPFEGEKYSITENKYDKNGNVIKTIQNVDDNKNSVTQNSYNAMGLLEKATLSDGTAKGEKNISKYFYDNAGVQVKMYTGMSSESDTSYLTTEYEYDSWLRAVRTTDSTGYNSGTITYDLNGNVLTNTDANGNVTTNAYDALNRVISSKTSNSKDSSKNVSKSYEYNNMGRITKVVSNDLTTSYVYDELGRKTEEYESKTGYSTFKGFFYEGISQYVKQEIVGISNLLMYSYTSYEYDAEMRVIKVNER